MKLLTILLNNPNLVISMDGCPHCVAAKNSLSRRGIPFLEINGRENQEVAMEVMKTHGHKTFPMIYIDKNFIGGNSDLQVYLQKHDSEKENRPL